MGAFKRPFDHREAISTLRCAEKEERPGAVAVRKHAWQADAGTQMLRRTAAGLAGAACVNKAVNEACIEGIDRLLKRLLFHLPAIASSSFKGFRGRSLKSQIYMPKKGRPHDIQGD